MAMQRCIARLTCMLLVECLDQLGGGRDVIDNDVESELPPVTSAAVKNAGWHVNKPMPNGKEVTSACEYR